MPIIRSILVAAAVTATAAGLLAAAPASAKPVAGGLLDLPGICTPASMKMAQLIDAKLAADKATFRMIVADQPKKGETGFVDGTVYEAMFRLAVKLNKGPADLTEADLANNSDEVAAAIAGALTYREKEREGSFTLEDKDASGNAVQLWCLVATADHKGPYSGLLYISAGGKPADGVWIGGSSFGNGSGTFLYNYDDDTGNFVIIVAEYYGPDPAAPGRSIRLTYVYEPGGKLSIIKEYGTFDDKGVFVADPKRTEQQRMPEPAPAELKDLRLNGERIGLVETDLDQRVRLREPSVTDLAGDPGAVAAVPWIIEVLLTGSP